MTLNTLSDRVKRLLAEDTTVALRPRYEGSNICTWIGFKHVNYLVEEAVLDHFRTVGLPARALFEEFGLGLDFVELDTRIGHALHMDDLVDAEVFPTTADGDTTLRFRVVLTVERDGERVRAATAKVRVLLVPDDYLDAAAEPNADLARYTARTPAGAGAVRTAPAPEENTSLSAGRGTSGGDPVLDQLTAGENAFGWKWRIPYPYCHFTERIQMSGYLRQMEEVVDLFLADRDISIKQLLDDRRWIPVVPRSSVRVLEHALMEEDLYTVYTVEEVFKEHTYTSRMDCYVVRDGQLVQTATGHITHGYALIENRRDWSLVSFDERVLKAFNGAPAAG
ncbi:hypothetical protein MTF65_22575 [Streptomyces sp. APSN-46.1]|uniref:hypothetical protein n=1 Tax=Streptomyces sp. APSN-46.1 TaxID=2929049 RepID=UPI001FB4B1E2|nr:hypothetical protein [Streptomyces sp. APSN-46.1]MCJ1680074.1 hypothetical protein [Streptomyces sp. APSN-46.1]